MWLTPGVLHNPSNLFWGHYGSAVPLGVIFWPLENTFLSGKHFDAVPFREDSGVVNDEMLGTQGWPCLR